MLQGPREFFLLQATRRLQANRSQPPASGSLLKRRRSSQERKHTQRRKKIGLIFWARSFLHAKVNGCPDAESWLGNAVNHPWLVAPALNCSQGSAVEATVRCFQNTWVDHLTFGTHVKLDHHRFQGSCSPHAALGVLWR